jgi:hypothetical protein
VTHKHTTAEVPDLEQEKFFPRGAMAFFFAMIVLYVAIWFSVYFVMIGRR